MIGAIDELLAPLLITLERMMWVQRHLHPQLAGQLADQLAPPAEGIAAPLRALEDATWPENLVFMRERLLDVGHRTLDMVKGFVEAARTSADPLISIGRCAASPGCRRRCSPSPRPSIR